MDKTEIQKNTGLLGRLVVNLKPAEVRDNSVLCGDNEKRKKERLF